MLVKWLGAGALEPKDAGGGMHLACQGERFQRLCRCTTIGDSAGERDAVKKAATSHATMMANCPLRLAISMWMSLWAPSVSEIFPELCDELNEGGI